MEQSILLSTKKVLAVAMDDLSFDLDIITHINSVFSTLQQLGVGPETGFSIVDETAKWTDFTLENPAMLGQVKTYVFLRVRMLFDPPQTSYLINAFEKQIQEHEWRLNQVREGYEWIDPMPPPEEVVY